MRLRKRGFITLVLLLLVGYFGLQYIHPIQLINKVYPFNKNCPRYIDEFVEKNPQAIDLKTYYQPNENNDPIDLEITDDIPLLIQWDKRWAYTHYGDEIVGTAGCGPTCLSMVTVGLTGNPKYNPRYVAKYAIENGYLEDNKTRWALMERGCHDFGLRALSVPLSNYAMQSQLNAGHPIIASVRPGDFTTTGHFIVITKVKNDQFTVNDPNSYDNSNKTWSYEQLASQIKAMWAYTLL